LLDLDYLITTEAVVLEIATIKAAYGTCTKGHRIQIKLTL